MLGKTFTRQALAALSGLPERRARAAPRVARAQGGPRRPGRPALARARPVRVPPGPAAHGRLRDAVASATARRRHLAAAAYLERAWATRTRSSRSSPPTTSTPTRRPRTRTTRPRSEPRPARALARAGERAASLGANDEAQRYFSRRPSSRTTPLAKAELHERAGRMAWRGSATAERGARILESAHRALRRRGSDRAAPPESPSVLAEIDFSGGAPARTQSLASRRRSRRCRQRNRTRIVADGRRAARPLSRAQSAVRPRGSATRDRARPRRGASPARGLRPGARRRKSVLYTSAEPSRRGAHPAQGALERALEHDLARRRASGRSTISRSASSRTIGTRRRSSSPTGLWSSPAASATASGRAIFARRADQRPSAARRLGRGARARCRLRTRSAGTASMQRSIRISSHDPTASAASSSGQRVARGCGSGTSEEESRRAIAYLVAEAQVLRAEGQTARGARDGAETRASSRSELGHHVPDDQAGARRGARGGASRSATRPSSRSCSLSSKHFARASVRRCSEAHAHRFRAKLDRRRSTASRPRRALFRELSLALLAGGHAARARRMAHWSRAAPDEAEPLLAEARAIFERLGGDAVARAGRRRRSAAGRGAGMNLPEAAAPKIATAGKFCGECGTRARASRCPSCGAAERARREVLRRVRRAAVGAAAAAPARADAPRPRPSAGSCRCCSPTSSASRRVRERATRRRRASCSRATSTPAGG